MPDIVERHETRNEKNFHAILEQLWNKERFACVGLDIEYDRIPEHIKIGKKRTEAMVAFGKAIIDATHDYVLAYKPQSAHYEAEGSEGYEALFELVHYIHNHYPDIPVILDAKRGDIKSTNEKYAEAIFDTLGADAVTLQPYLGGEPLEPFLQRKEKGCIILCRTSNPGAGEIQDLLIDGLPLWQKVALLVKESWNKNDNCSLVIGATYPDEMKVVRSIVGNLPFLMPGIGAQGGDIHASVQAGMDSNKQGMIINSARGILYASSSEDFAERAREKTKELNDAINAARV